MDRNKFIYGVLVSDQDMFELAELRVQHTDFNDEDELHCIRQAWEEHELSDDGFVPVEDSVFPEGEMTETHVHARLDEMENKLLVPLPSLDARMFRLDSALDERQPFVIGVAFRLFTKGRLIAQNIDKAARRFRRYAVHASKSPVSSIFTHLFLDAKHLCRWTGTSPDVAGMIVDFLHTRPGVFLHA